MRFPPGPISYRLDRLEHGFVRQLLDRLTIRDGDGASVIEEPERGWTRLRDRLVRDLEQTAVLPQQLKVTLGGLSGFKGLNVAAYERSGAIAGLEAGFIERSIARAERASGLSSVEIRSLVLDLVDRERQAKTAPKPETALASILPGGSSPEGRVMRRVHEALTELERTDVVRQRSAPSAELTVWQLDHDYLSRGILELERRADRWRVLLEERATAFAEAGSSLVRRWRALLSVPHQLQLVFARLGRRFRYGQYWGYALWSTLRLVPVGGEI